MPPGAVGVSYALHYFDSFQRVGSSDRRHFYFVFMVNLDTRLLTSDISDSELRLLLTFAKFMNKDFKLWPSNAVLLECTGWSMGKLQLTKKSLETKGFLKIEKNFNAQGQTSNIYTITCNLISVFVNVDQFKMEEKVNSRGAKNRAGVYATHEQGGYNNQLGGMLKNEQGGCQKTNSEVLTNEVLINEVLTNNNKENEKFSEPNQENKQDKSQKPNENDSHRADALKKAAISAKDAAKEVGYKTDSTLVEAFQLYLDYRKEMKLKPFASVKSAGIALKQLKRLSEDSRCTSLEIVEQTIASLWTGLFPLKRDKSQQNGKTHYQPIPEEYGPQPF